MAYLAHPLLTIAGFALLPRVFRRFGYGYGTYALLVIGLSCLGTKNFFGMARYVMAAGFSRTPRQFPVPPPLRELISPTLPP